MRFGLSAGTRGAAPFRTERVLTAPFAIAAAAILFYCFPWLRRVFGWVWVIGRPDVIGWWPVEGRWFWFGVGAMALTVLISVWCYSVGKSNRTALATSMVGAVIALTLLTIGGRSRIEVRANDIRVTSDRFGEADVIYRVDNAVGMTVSCKTGGRGSVYPSLYVWFQDGRELELQALTSRGANPGMSRVGLAFAEGLDGVLIDRRNRHVGAIGDRCVDKTERRLGQAERPRIGALFAPDLVEVAPGLARDTTVVLDLTPRPYRLQAP
jgi:hypothetical protein